MPRMPWRRGGIGLGFDEAFLLALKRPRNGSAAPLSTRRPLPPGLVRASAIQPNFESVSEVGRLVSEMVEELDSAGQPMSMLLPDLTVKAALYPPDRENARASSKKLKDEFLASLPFPATEGRFDSWRGQSSELLFAVVRDAVALQYEQVASAARCSPSWLDTVSTSNIPAWARLFRNAEAGLAIQVQLYRRHYVLTMFRGPELAETRIKLRAPGEVRAVADEILRLAGLETRNGDAEGRFATVEVFGGDADLCAAALADGPFRQVEAREATDEAHLEASLKQLLTRSGS